jgi:hypothetical protein
MVEEGLYVKILQHGQMTANPYLAIFAVSRRREMLMMLGDDVD